MSNAPKITVLLPVYNAAEYLRPCIDSILAQTYSDFEFLIIDDGSKDDSVEIISSYSDKRIRLLRNSVNSGLIFTLNRGLQESKGDYIARMDADDIALPTRLEKQLKAMEEDGRAAVAASFVEFINADGEVTGIWSTDREAVTEDQIRALMMKTNCIAHPSVMLRAKAVSKYSYNRLQPGAEDWDLWMRLLADGERIIKLPEVLLQYRLHPASITGKDKAGAPLEIRLIRIKRKFLIGQLLRGRVNGFWLGVKVSAVKNLARHIVSNKLPHWLRDVKRILTSPPWKVIQESRQFHHALKNFSGKHVLIFPYMHVGGAERVHASIADAIKDQNPLIVFSAFSDNDKFLSRFVNSGTVLCTAHYINYPFTRSNALRLLSAKLNSAGGAFVLGSNAGYFYDLIPFLSADVKVIDLIHAFKYQEGGNLAHRGYLRLAMRINERIFVSEAARCEFEKFCFHNSIPLTIRERMKVIANAVPVPPLSSGSQSKPGILFVGRNSPEKRLNLFLRVAEKLNDSAQGKFRFTVVGAARTGNYPYVEFAGEITDDAELQQIYSEHRFLVLTSGREGFPVVIMEAMACGLVVIATPVGDIPNRLNGSNGIVLTSTEEDQVVKEATAHILELIQSPETLSSIQEDAKKYAQKNFGEQRFISEYRSLLGVKD